MTDFWTDTAGVLKSIAPVIASAVGTPVAGVAVSALLNAVWPNDQDKTSADLATAITAGTLTGDQVVAMRKADNDFKVQMETLNLNLSQMKVQQETVELADVANARAMQSNPVSKSTTPTILAYMTMAMFTGAVAVTVFAAVPTAAQQTLDILFGVLVGAFKDIYGFYFGSSQGKQAQDQAMAAIAAQPSIPAGSTLVDTSKGLPWQGQTPPAA